MENSLDGGSAPLNIKKFINSGSAVKERLLHAPHVYLLFLLIK